MAKRPGKHIANALTPRRVETIKQAGRHADGGGLYLEVEPTGGKRWTLRIVRRMADASGKVIAGKRVDVGLGRVADVSLAQARSRAAELRFAAAAGQDIVAIARAGRIKAGAPLAKALTFAEVAEQVHVAIKPSFKNHKHAMQWLTTLKTYAFPHLGDLPIAEIDQPHCLRVLSPIWLGKPETARRVRQRLKMVFDWAKSHGHRSGDNPTSGIEHGLPQQTDKVRHHEALAIDAVPGFIAALRACDRAENATRLALEFLVLTATRDQEVRLAHWSEIDLTAKTWTIPDSRMKAGAEHTVPLSDRALGILEEMAQYADASEGLIFPGKNGRRMSENTFASLAKSVSGIDAITAHGFRSTFRDWAAERTSFPSDVAEMALAHSIRNKVEAAYRRGSLLEKRRDLMAAWSQFCEPNTESGNVVTLAAARQ